MLMVMVKMIMVIYTIDIIKMDPILILQEKNLGEI